MAKTRSELREKCMVILYQWDLFNMGNNSRIDELIKNNLEIENDFVKEIVNGVVEKKDEIDKIANKYLNEWTIDRLEATGKSILRIAIYELKHTDTPEIVVINEAVELAKKYSDDNVRKIINAVLDKIINE